MKVDHLVKTSVANNEDQSSVVHLDTVLDENPDSVVNLLLHERALILFYNQTDLLKESAKLCRQNKLRQ